MDHFLAAQQAAEAHIEACWAYLHDEDSSDDPEAPEPDMMAPFCGCLTCEVREILHAAMPHLRAGIAAGD